MSLTSINNNPPNNNNIQINLPIRLLCLILTGAWYVSENYICANRFFFVSPPL